MHLRDLSEADLPENQRGLVISEIALFRERAAVKRAEASGGGGGFRGSETPAAPSRSAGVGGFSGVGNMASVPSGPKERAWGRNARRDSADQQPASDGKRQSSFGNGPQGYQQSPNFVKGEPAVEADNDKSDEELERERIGARKREEDESFRDVSFYFRIDHKI